MFTIFPFFMVVGVAVPDFLDCMIMKSLAAVEQYIISERVNFTNHNIHVEVTLYDKISQVGVMITHR